MNSSRTSRRPPLRSGFGGGDALLDDGNKGLCKLIAASKTSGTLNLSNRQLEEVPADVFQLPANDDNVKWWEAVELTKLDLSHNLIAHLPEQLWNLSALATLLLSNNWLQQLLPGISALQSLRMLDLSDNPLGPTLPEDVAMLPTLATLNCNSCGLQQLPPALGGPQQPKLSAISACSNQLSCLPEGLSAASALVVLKASHNQLQELPGRLVRGWRSLKELDLAHNNLQELPVELGGLPALAQLDARNNQLSMLPGALGGAARLLELQLGFNKLTSLPATLGALANLKTLDLRNNLVEEFPEPLCGLSLVLLDLTNNCLRRLPPALGHMTSLRSLPLDGNPLKLMRRELWAGPLSALLQHLRDQEKLSSTPAQQCDRPTGGVLKGHSAAGAADVLAGAVSLRGRGLSSVPAEVWEAADSVTSLDVSDINLAGDAANLSTGLPRLAALKVLTMSSCSLASWPMAGLSPGCLKELHTLDVRGNAFGRCPVDALAACPQLRHLDVSGVRSLQLPEGMFSCTPQLEVLVASRAGLVDFPSAVLSCSSLKQLNLSSNSLSSVPVQITQLTRLQELDLQNNQLSNLPPQMGLMGPGLRVLLLEGNCIRVIRRPVLDKGTSAVLEWLKDRIPTA